MYIPRPMCGAKILHWARHIALPPRPTQNRNPFLLVKFHSLRLSSHDDNAQQHQFTSFQQVVSSSGPVIEIHQRLVRTSDEAVEGSSGQCWAGHPYPRSSQLQQGQPCPDLSESTIGEPWSLGVPSWKGTNL